jgi:outer membrane usher protein FimD/PapC
LPAPLGVYFLFLTDLCFFFSSMCICRTRFTFGGVDRQGNLLQLTVNQNLGGRWGRRTQAAQPRSYWNRGGTTTQFETGCENLMRIAGMSIGCNLISYRYDAAALDVGRLC